MWPSIIFKISLGLRFIVLNIRLDNMLSDLHSCLMHEDKQISTGKCALFLIILNGGQHLMFFSSHHLPFCKNCMSPHLGLGPNNHIYTTWSFEPIDNQILGWHLVQTGSIRIGNWGFRNAVFAGCLNLECKTWELLGRKKQRKTRDPKAPGMGKEERKRKAPLAIDGFSFLVILSHVPGLYFLPLGSLRIAHIFNIKYSFVLI